MKRESDCVRDLVQEWKDLEEKTEGSQLPPSPQTNSEPFDEYENWWENIEIEMD